MQEMQVRSLVRKIRWRRKQQLTPVFLSGESHGQRSLAGYSPWGRKRVGHDWATSLSFSVRSLPFLSFIEPIFAWNFPLVSLIFLKRSLIFPILLFFSFFALIPTEGFLISPCYSLELCIQMGISFLFSLLFTSLLFTAICKVSSDSHFAFLHFFFLG